MKNILIALFSPTYAEKTARLLREYGVRASRVTLPRSLVREGCAAGVLAEGTDRETVGRILSGHGIPFRRLFDA